jgi:hypothetical protein
MHLHLEDMATYVDTNRRREAACRLGWRGADRPSATIVRGQRTMGRVDPTPTRRVPMSFAPGDRPPDQPRPTAGRAPVL